MFKDVEWDIVLIMIISVLCIFGMFGMMVYTEHTKSECVKQSLEHKLTVTEVQVLCGN